MSRTDQSVTFLTGMIIAALYVILLIGFSRESYMRRDAEARGGARASSRVVEDTANSMCRTDRQVCLSGASRPFDASQLRPRRLPLPQPDEAKAP